MRVLPLYVLLGGWLAVPALAANDPAQLMSRLIEAEKSRSFSGDFVYQRNTGFSTYSIWQQVDANGVSERLVQLDGALSEVVRRNGEIRCATLEERAVPSIDPVRSLARVDPGRLAASYELRVVGDSRVAGRPTTAMAVIPRDQHRYGFELHVDKASGLLAKSLLLNEQGQLLERLQFTRLSVETVEAEQVEGQHCEAVETAERALAEDRQVRWHSEWVPPGFERNDAEVRQSPASDEQVAWLSYSDGLARFSVFVEPLRGEAVADARTQMGPTAIVSKRLPAEGGDVMVTVVGEIPMGTAERIALSMRAEGSQTGQ